MPEISFRNATLDDASALAFVQVAGWHDTYKGIISEARLAKFTHEGQTEMWKKIIPKHRGFMIAMCNDKQEIIGYVSGGQNRTDELECDGEIYAIYLLKEYHGTGVGRQLFFKGINQLAEMGYRSFCLYVLKESRTVSFYKKFNPDMEISVKDAEEGDISDTLGLGWSDINKFRT